MSDTFGRIIVVYKCSEPLYEFLETKIGADKIKFYTKLAELPQPNQIDGKQFQQLLVFDDQVNCSDKEQSIMLHMIAYHWQTQQSKIPIAF